MSKSKGKYKYLLSVAFLIIVSAITVYALLKEVNIEEMWKIILNVNIFYLASGLLFVTMYYICIGASIKTIISSLGHKVRFREAYAYGCINEFYSLITPFGSGGQPFMIYYMMHDGVTGPKVSISTLLNLLEYKLVLLVYSVIIVIFKPGLVFNNGALVIILFAFASLINIAIILLTAMSMLNDKLVRKLGAFIYRLLSKIGIIKKEQLEQRIEGFYKQVEEYKNGVKYIKSHLSIFFKAFLFNFLKQTAYFGISYIVYLSFGLPATAWFDVIMAQALIYITVDSLPLPGGVGITEKLFLDLYRTIYTVSMITPAVLLTRFINYILAIIFGGIFAFSKQIAVVRGSKAKTA